MPTMLKVLLYTTAASVILFGLVSYPRQPAAQQAVAEHLQSATQRWAAESMAELDGKPEAEHRSDRYEACARDVWADYSDDPEQAYGWIRTLCHY
jgi:hypothetical protein